MNDIRLARVAGMLHNMKERGESEFDVAKDIIAYLAPQPDGVRNVTLYFENTAYGCSGPDVSQCARVSAGTWERAHPASCKG